MFMMIKWSMNLTAVQMLLLQLYEEGAKAKSKDSDHSMYVQPSAMVTDLG